MSVGEFGKKAINSAVNELKGKAKKYMMRAAIPVVAGVAAGMGLIVAIGVGISGEEIDWETQSSASWSGGYNFGESTTQMEGIDLYNADGSVNEAAIDQLENILNGYVGLEGIGPNNGVHSNFNRVADWLQEGRIFQCPWWAVGRANYYLSLIGSEKRVARTDGAKVITHSHNVKNFTIGKEPRPNSLICWGPTKDNDYGHVGYVEAVDSVTGDIWVSEAGGARWWRRNT